MKLLAFDQATKITGWAVLEDGTPVRYGHIDECDVDSPAARIREMYLSIARLVDEEQPDLLIFEAVQQQANAKTMLMLSQLQGMCLGKAYSAGVDVYSPLPVEWRKILEYKQGAHVKRAELKQQSKDYVQSHFNIVATEDECEAICIGVAADKIYNK